MAPCFCRVFLDFGRTGEAGLKLGLFGAELYNACAVHSVAVHSVAVHSVAKKEPPGGTVRVSPYSSGGELRPKKILA